MSAPTYNVGSVIEYRTVAGLRRVRVEEKGEIKNGRDGFCGALLSGADADVIDAAWGYDDQITRVVTP